MARAASGGKAGAEGEPNPRIDTSKPGRDTRSGRSAADAGEAWEPPQALAPGLHLVATPIGNLGDITLRALWTLRSADRILCEDTRVTAKLLRRYGIEKPLQPYHDYNAERVRPGILAALSAGERIALVSDAGTPLVSDPGYKLVREALAEAIPVTAAPGPSAAVTALILSGLPPDRFLFGGFLPPRAAARRRALAELATASATLIFYEGASRLAAALADMAEMLGDREAAVARELTKLHEELRRGSLPALAAHYRDAGPPRGELVVVVAPPQPQAAEPADIEARLRGLLMEASLKDAVTRLADETGLGRRDLYRRALALRQR